MAFKDILVLLDNHGNYESRLQVALALAQQNKARLVALYHFELPQKPVISLNLADTPYEANDTSLVAYERERDTAYGSAADLKAVFHQAASRAGVSSTWELRPETPKDLIDLVIRRVRYADLAVLGQSDPDHPLFDTLAKLPEAVMLGCGRPVLIVPYGIPSTSVGKRVLIAWNGSREAARAVADALPLLQSADIVTVLTIDAIEDTEGQTDRPARHLLQHLAQHAVRAEVSHMASDGLQGEDIILSRATDLGCDLIVMGGYGHSRAREMVLGGVTRAILRHMTVPVLMSH